MSKGKTTAFKCQSLSTDPPKTLPIKGEETGNPFLREALVYAKRGWPVIPLHWPESEKCSCGNSDCGSVAKHPLTAHGLKDASTDPAILKKWWHKWPQANVGIVTGEVSGLVVLDIDPRNGGNRSMDRLQLLGSLPDTPTANTGGGGQHYLFQHPDNGAKLRGKVKGYEGIDIKGNGYIVAPPSRHHSGGTYQWEVPPHAVSLATMPDWLLSLVLDSGQGKEPSAPVGKSIPHGERNTTLTSLAGTMRHRGLSQEAIEIALLAENTKWCDPPLAEAEVRSIARSMARYEPSSQTDPHSEIARLIQGLNKDTPLFEKLKQLFLLAPILARLPHLEVTALVERWKTELGLRQKDLIDLERDVKEARKKALARGNQDARAVEIKDLAEVRRLHPAIDFPDDQMTVGFRVHQAKDTSCLLLIISDGANAQVTLAPKTVEIGGKPYEIPRKVIVPYLKEVWGLTQVQLLLNSFTKPDPRILWKDLKDVLRTYLDLLEPAYGLLAAWSVGTYFAHLFTAYPFLHLLGTKAAGKSKSLEALKWICFNAWKGRDISAAALGDLIEGRRSTVLFDQAESLAKGDKENNLIGLLADSYKKSGGKRLIINHSKGDRQTLEFSTYGPKVFASTRPLDPDLADRCVRIPMVRTRRRLPDLEGWEPVWGNLRDACYRFALSSFKEVHNHYQAIPGDGTRLGELWRPIYAVLRVLGPPLSEMEEIRHFFMEGARENQHEPSGWELALLESLKERAICQTEDFEMTPEEIITAMGIEGDKQPFPKWVGDTLSQYALYEKRDRPKRQGRKVTVYTFNSQKVVERCETYLREPSQNDLPQLTTDIGDTASLLDSRLENEGGQEGTCPPKLTCPPQGPFITKENTLGHEGQENQRGVEEKNFQRGESAKRQCSGCRHFEPNLSNPTQGFGRCRIPEESGRPGAYPGKAACTQYNPHNQTSEESAHV